MMVQNFQLVAATHHVTMANIDTVFCMIHPFTNRDQTDQWKGAVLEQHHLQTANINIYDSLLVSITYYINVVILYVLVCISVILSYISSIVRYNLLCLAVWWDYSRWMWCRLEVAGCWTSQTFSYLHNHKVFLVLCVWYISSIWSFHILPVRQGVWTAKAQSA